MWYCEALFSLTHTKSITCIRVHTTKWEKGTASAEQQSRPTRPKYNSSSYCPPPPFGQTLSLTTIVAALCNQIMDEVYCSFSYGRKCWYSASSGTLDFSIHLDDFKVPFPFLKFRRLLHLSSQCVPRPSEPRL